MKLGLCCQRLRSPRRGSVLIIVLVTIVVLSLSAYTFTALMQTEEEASRLMTRRVQSKYLVDSGVDFMRLFLTNNEEALREKGGIWNNPALQNIVVAVDPNRPERVGRFTVITSNMDEEGVADGFRYGLTDESAKLNLNTLPYADAYGGPGTARGLLMNLPNMTEAIADAIVDWIDADDDTRDFGAESSFYASQSYACKNAPMDSLEELLLVRDVLPFMLYGVDTNRNGIVDDDELNDPNISALENDMLLGWANYLTLYSKESNLTPEFLPRININSPDLQQLYDDLRSSFDEEYSRYIINYRQKYDEMWSRPNTIKPVPAATAVLDFNEPSIATFRSVLDLFENRDIQLTGSTANTAIPWAESPFTEANKSLTLPIVMQTLTTQSGTTIPGRINVMQAPARVLAGIPGMTPDLLETILELREFELDDPELTDKNRKYETWLYEENHVNLQTMKDMLPFVCAGGDVYRAEIVGYFDDGVATSRCEAVIDTTSIIPRLLFWRDKSQLQAGYSIDVLGIDLNQ